MLAPRKVLDIWAAAMMIELSQQLMIHYWTDGVVTRSICCALKRLQQGKIDPDPDWQ